MTMTLYSCALRELADIACSHVNDPSDSGFDDGVFLQAAGKRFGGVGYSIYGKFATASPRR